ncbi:DNA processing protein DprA [Chryseobacterium sp. Leaf180]|uniref:DNA-processing protein DprA n=1 Tax=Chryseobacterium sp. Leaf180 TaxID=1736289 RepID=UPI0007005753|nr:DNA-processing protein DprA [Chryseobacterium sp. Leaf180]KQR95329.1 DNA processing protein DprA [Chryseobacterium sp. Leaf180]
MYSDEQLYSIALRRCSFIGDINFFKLARAFGSAKNVWQTPKKDLAHIDGIGRKTISDIGNSEHLGFAEEELKFCEKNAVRIRLRHLNELPFILSECEDAPAILYQKGDFNEDLKPISLVGTRNITAYGKKFVEDFFEQSKNQKYISVSGLALGVDKEVHEQSLKNNIPTIGVLAHGFHTFYPSKNRFLAEKMIENGGALLSEFNSSQKPDRENFIQRNRIVAGVSPATLVVETAFGGGSISTATFANIYNRDVFALPGKITDKYSQGCNHLIFQNKATAISNLPDLFDLLGIGETNNLMGELFPQKKIHVNLTDAQQEIFDEISANPNITLDDLAEKIARPSHKILPTILELELLGAVKSLSGRQFLAV